MTRFDSLEYFDPERELAIEVERDRFELLGVYAFTRGGQQVPLSSTEVERWLDQANADLIDDACEAADAALQEKWERDL